MYYGIRKARKASIEEYCFVVEKINAVCGTQALPGAEAHTVYFES